MLGLPILFLACAREPLSPGGSRAGHGPDNAQSVWARLAEGVGPQTAPVKLDEYARVRYVAQDRGSDAHGEGSKEKPWASLIHALNQCRDASSDKRVAMLVGAGTYHQTVLGMKPHVDLYGGYDASEWSRDIWKSRTILQGDGIHRILLGASHSRLDGFLLTGGKVRGKGGAILCEGVSPALTNNVFIGNGTLIPVPWKPKLIHEKANDGGAIACLNGASPTIQNNLFVGNTTEAGRGGAVACDLKASPAILRNVFLNNESGLKDPMRSSDGGAISVFEYSHPEIRDNLVIQNKALASNDGGGIFVALWSSPVISGNLIVGNACTDDAGGLFIGGQEHRYGVPLDPVPPPEEFLVHVERNLIVGNTNPNRKSGAMRITMESRAELVNNIVAGNNGGVYLQRSELVLRNNTILQDARFVEEKETVGPGNFVNNIFRGGFDLKAKATVAYCNIEGGAPGSGNLDSDPRFFEDGHRGQARAKEPDGQRFELTLERLNGPTLRPNELAGRPVRLGESWTVVRTNDSSRFVVWGTLPPGPISETAIDFEVLPSWHLRPESPCVDSGTNQNAPSRDFEGDSRPLNGTKSLTVDIGADEYQSQ